LSFVFHVDETTLPTLSPGSGKMKPAWLRTYARDDRTFSGTTPPMVAYRFEDNRGEDSGETISPATPAAPDRRLERLQPARRCTGCNRLIANYDACGL
jgi:hypothetical protein